MTTRGQAVTSYGSLDMWAMISLVAWGVRAGTRTCWVSLEATKRAQGELRARLHLASARSLVKRLTQLTPPHCCAAPNLRCAPHLQRVQDAKGGVGHARLARLLRRRHAQHGGAQRKEEPQLQDVRRCRCLAQLLVAVLALGQRGVLKLGGEKPGRGAGR